MWGVCDPARSVFEGSYGEQYATWILKGPDFFNTGVQFHSVAMPGLYRFSLVPIGVLFG